MQSNKPSGQRQTLQGLLAVLVAVLLCYMYAVLCCAVLWRGVLCCACHLTCDRR
jgi:hypothetical protein